MVILNSKVKHSIDEKASGVRSSYGETITLTLTLTLILSLSLTLSRTLTLSTQTLTPTRRSVHGNVSIWWLRRSVHPQSKSSAVASSAVVSISVPSSAAASGPHLFRLIDHWEFKHSPYPNITTKHKQYDNSVDGDGDKITKNDNNYNGNKKNDKITTITTIVVAEVTKATKVTIRDSKNDNDNDKNDKRDNSEKSNNK